MAYLWRAEQNTCGIVSHCSFMDMHERERKSKTGKNGIGIT